VTIEQWAIIKNTPRMLRYAPRFMEIFCKKIGKFFFTKINFKKINLKKNDLKKNLKKNNINFLKTF
jgi:hypothetical protein